MKYLKYILAVSLIAAVTLTVIYQRRDSIARDIANTMLVDSGLSVIDVSLDTLTTSRVVFDSLELAFESGMRIVVRRLEAPIDFPSLNPEYVSIREIEIIAAAEPADASPLTPLARNYLALPSRFPSTAIAIGRIARAGLPALENLVWTTGEEFQRLRFTAGGFTVDADTMRADPVSHRIALTVTDRKSALALDADVAIIDQAGDVQISAYGALPVSPWLPLVEGLGAWPAGIGGVTGTLIGMADIRLDSESAGRLEAVLTVATETEIGFETSPAGGARFDVTVPVGRPSELRIEWPEVRWSLRSAESRWSTTIEGLESLPLRISELDCSDEIVCSFDAAIGPGTLNWNGFGIDRVMATLPLRFSTGETPRLETTREPSLFLTGIRHDALSAGSLNTLGFGEVRVEFAEGGVTAAASHLTANLSTIAAGELALNALALRLDNLTIDGEGLSAGFRTPGKAGKLDYQGYAMRLPETSGSLRISGGSVDVGARLDTEEGYLDGDGRLHLDLETGSGSLTVDRAAVDFGARSLKRLVEGIEADIDIVGGSASLAAELKLGSASPGRGAASTFDIELADLAGHYRDIAATGISGQLPGVIEDEVITLNESTINAELIDVGLPLEKLSARFRASLPGKLAVEDLELQMLGGQLMADPFIYDPDAESVSLVLRTEGIQLPFMAELAGFESLDVEGSLKGEIPVTITDDNLRISGGRLDNEPPGGVIRFNADTAAAAGSANVDIASRALKNFHFDALSSDVEYGEDGDLVLKMRLSGINPDMDPNQPIILNLNVENNIPELLRSLQAVRSIEDILERRSQGL